MCHSRYLYSNRQREIGITWGLKHMHTIETRYKFLELHDKKRAQYHCCCPLTISLHQISHNIKDPVKPISRQTR